MNLKHKNRYGKAAVALLTGGILLCGSSAYVFAMPRVTVNGKLETGKVDIALSQYQSSEDGALVACDGGVIEDILPGQVISRTERITNSGANCYIRVKQTMDVDGVLNTAYKSDGWVQGNDGYIYKKEQVSERESVDLPMVMTANKDMTEELQGTTVHQSIRAEAIQAANFTPDFDSTDPWGGVQIIDAVAEDGYESEVAGSQKLSVTYQGDAKELVANADDVFGNFETLMPGGTYTDSLLLKNNSDNPADMYFNSNIDTTKGDARLYEALHLTIVFHTADGDMLLHDGSLQDASMAIMKLATLPAGTEGELIYTIDFPAEYDNAYSMMYGEIEWIFSTNENIIEVPDKTPDATPEQTGQNDKTADEVKPKENPSEPSSGDMDGEVDEAQTGENVIPGALLGISGLACIIAGIACKKKGKKDEKESGIDGKESH